MLVLVSGGLDSPVAARMLQENGHEVGAIHFSQEPFTDDGPEQKSAACCKQLGIEELWVAQAGSPFGELAKACNHAYYFVLSKRLMLRAAAEIARREGYDAVATGESLGQVSSQTLQNLACVHEPVDVPVLTPLLALDKNEIVRLTEEIGTFDMSTGPEMCDALGPDHPVTWAQLDRVEEEEKKVDVAAMTAAIVDASSKRPIEVAA